MKQSNTRKIVETALFAALTCVATMLIRIPSPTNGYVNLGDAVILLGAFLLGPFYGAAAGGIGAALADFFAGYATFVPGTLVIKAAVALSAGLIYRKFGKKSALPAGVVGEILMVLGYFGYETLLLGSALGSAAGIPGNLVQGAFGVAASTALVVALHRNSYVRKSYPAF